MAGIGLNTDTRNNSGGIGLGLGGTTANSVFTPSKLEIPKLTPFNPSGFGKSALSNPLSLSNMFGKNESDNDAGSSSGEGSNAGSYSTSNANASNTNTITNTATTGNQTQNLTINQVKDSNKTKDNILLIIGGSIVVLAIMGITMVSLKK